MSIRRRAVHAIAATGMVAGVSIGVTGTASAGEIVIIDDGRQCTAVLRTDDGGYTDWWRA